MEVTVCTLDANDESPLSGSEVEVSLRDQPQTRVSDFTGVDGCATLRFEVSTAIGDDPDLPTRFSTAAAYPNPVERRVVVPFFNNVDQQVSAGLYDVLGRRLAVSAPVRIAPGSQSLEIDVSALSPGLYFYRIEGPGGAASGRFVKAGMASGTEVSLAFGPATGDFVAGKSTAGTPLAIRARREGYTQARMDTTLNDRDRVNVHLERLTGVTPPAAPTLVSPPDGATGVDAGAVTLTWNAASGATSYDVEVAADAAFAGVVASASGVTATSYAVSGLSPNTTYYWHARSGGSGGLSGWSGAFSFTTADGGTPPPPGDVPGGDTTSPFPIDMGDAGTQTPGSYKGLPLRLVDTGEPTVTPVNGKIGVVCIGMSNSSRECSDYITRYANSPERNPQVVVVDCAVGGHAIERWIDPSFDDKLWDECANRKLPNNGLAVEEVRVIYHKAADMFTAVGDEKNDIVKPPYPDPGSDYFSFVNNLEAFAGRVKAKFPNVQAVYTTSRSYGGFSPRATRGEPLSYEEGHALNTWIATLPPGGMRDGVWYGWGPYIWAGECGQGLDNASGVCYVRSDYEEDGVHPALGAKEKISMMIHARFMQHSWYRND